MKRVAMDVEYEEEKGRTSESAQVQNEELGRVMSALRKDRCFFVLVLFLGSSVLSSPARGGRAWCVVRGRLQPSFASVENKQGEPTGETLWLFVASRACACMYQTGKAESQ